MSVDSFSQSGPEVASAYRAGRAVIAGTQHCVSTGHYLATQAAFHILEAGGNAVDAGVAAALTLAVVHSDQVNVAGVAPMIIWLADRQEVVTIDGLGTWPKAATCDLFVREHAGQIPEGILRTVVPAAPAAHILALSRYGTCSFGEVAQFAIRFARDGFVMYPFMSEQIKLVQQKIARWASSSAIYLPDNRPPEVGDIFVQRDLANTLQYMADEERASLARGGDRLDGLQAARRAFYTGDIANRIAQFHRENGGLLTADDLREFDVNIESPVKGRFNGMDVYSCGFWCQGPTLPQVLHILSGLDLVSMGHNSPDYIHHVAEALKLVFADREAFYGDPKFVDVPAAQLLSEAYADERRKMIDPRKAWPELPSAGLPHHSVAGATKTSGELDGPFDTSCVTIVDKKGNAICIAPSDVCSDTPVIPGTGLAPSSRGSQSWGTPGHASAVAAGKRPRLTPSPAMLVQPGKLIMPIGSPGGDSQTQAITQVLLNMFVFGMDPQTAIEQPRFITYSHPDSFAPHNRFPGRLCLEGLIDAGTAENLSAKGHQVVMWPERLWRAGGVCTVRHDIASGRYEAGADPRRAAASANGW